MTYEERERLVHELTGGDQAKRHLTEATYWDAMRESSGAWAFDPAAHPYAIPRPCTCGSCSSCHFHNTLLR